MRPTAKSRLQFLKFAAFSASAGVVQILTYTLMNEGLALPQWLCYLTALIASVLYNFTINRKFTFKAANNIPVAMLKVAGYYCVFAPLSSWWGQALTDIDWNEYVVLLGTMAVNVSTEFLFCKYVVYRDKKSED